MEYQQQSAELDHRILALIETWHRGDVIDEKEIDAAFLDVARYQWEFNLPYRRFVDFLERDISAIRDVRAIPAVPASAFKDAALTTVESSTVEAIFRTSGTTMQHRGRHFMESTVLYAASSLAIFDRLVLAPRNLLGTQTQQLRFLSLVPNARERNDSSLGFMVNHLMLCRGDGADRHLLSGDHFDLDELRASIHRAHNDGVTLCFFTTALAALNVLDALGHETLALPDNSIIIETGGFKGKQRLVTQSELYARLSQSFGIERANIIAEFGMTELTSQYYDLASSCLREPRIKVGPPWLRSFIVDAEGNEVSPGTVGALRHLDLANRSSVVAIDTEDLALSQSGGFVLLGREPAADVRGCSLDAEHLRATEERL